MTIASTPRRAGPFATNGVQTNFAFTFKVFDDEDLRVVLSEGGIETDLVLTTDYTVSLNADQNAAPGGTVTLLVAPDGPVVNILSDMDIEQPVVITNRGGFFPRVFNDVFDRLTIYAQQIAEKLDRALLAPLDTAAVEGQYPVVLVGGGYGFSEGTGNDPALRTDLATDAGLLLAAKRVGHGKRSFKTIREEQDIEVEDFRYTSAGVVRDDRDVFVEAIAAWQNDGGGKLVAANARLYDFGSFSTNAIVELLAATGLQNATFDGRGCTFKLNSTVVGARPMLWVLRNFKNLALRNFKVNDIGTDLTVDWRGVYAVVPTMDSSSGNSSGLIVDNVHVERGVAAYFTQGTVYPLIGQRLRMSAENTYYGANFAECGDASDIELHLKNCRRAYFAYGVRGHKAKLYVEHQSGFLGAETMCLIKRYGKDTGEIDLDLFVKGTLEEHAHLVTVEQQPNSGTGVIENVKVNYHLQGGMDYAVSAAAQAQYGVPAGTKCIPYSQRSYTAGGVEETSTTANIWRNITIGGYLGEAPGSQVDVRVKPTTPHSIALLPDSGVNPLKCITKGNVRFKTASNREFLTRTGNLTSGTFDIDLSRFDNQTLEIGVDLSLYGATDGAANQDQTSKGDTLFLRIPTGGPITIRGESVSRAAQSVGVAATSVTFGVSGKILTIAVAGAAYSGANAFGVADLTFRGIA